MRLPAVIGSLLATVATVIAIAGCRPGGDALFERRTSRETGIRFVNALQEDDSVHNPITFDYVYNGAGVAVGDFDGDGRPDVYLGGNMVSSRLYLNRGGLRFEDVTEAAGAGTDAWITGVTAADVDQDGRLDLYLCVGGPGPAAGRANRLLVNRGPDARGVPRFAERAAEYGLADTSYSTHAAFLDYDRDGDLDLYLLTNARESFSRNLIRPRLVRGEAASTDRLYRNDGGRFTDVSRAAGITVEGYGLGVAVSDIDQDGWPDVYVANDFLTNDLVWVNNRDGTFTNRAARYLKHQTHNGMGVDVADFDNDGRVDVAVVDMLPRDNARRKLMLPGGNYDKFHMSLGLGYEPQYMRNTLQLNNGPGPDGAPTFSEVGQLAGVDATDWSWAPLFADFDNDGRRDLFITNGYRRDVTNLDFIVYGQEAGMMGTPEARRARMFKALKELPEVKLPNHVFRNEGDLAFSDRTAAWGLGAPSFSNGAAYADLDGDGDLDLVVNNVDDEAFVFENRAERLPGRGSLRVAFRGPPGNRDGYGAKVVVTAGALRQYHDHSPYRGFQSTVEGVAHFGLGAAARADSVEVYWPDGAYQLVTGVPAGRVLTLDRRAATAARPFPAARAAPGDTAPPLFRPAPAGAPALRHADREVPDFKVTPLLPHKHSQGDPGVAVGDVNGDGLDDVYVGSDRGAAKTLLVQTAPGRFASRVIDADTRHEDTGALFFDADGDGDVDLYAVSGGSFLAADAGAYQDRLYVNDGRGGFRRDDGALPATDASGSCVVAADYDRDGDLDLFVCGRVTPGKYPLPPRSYLLRNDTRRGGPPRFADVTAAVAPALVRPGLVSGALWTDYDADGRVDLLLAGEWMPITLVRNEGGRFADVTAAAGLARTGGWWNGVAGGDFDGDGDTDYLVGNLGLNSRFRPSAAEPVRVYAADFDGNGSVDPVIASYVDGTSYPIASRDVLIDQMPVMKRRFRRYRDYATATLEQTLTPEERARARVAEVTTFATSYVENCGGGRFVVRPLPVGAQLAPTFGIVTGDHDGDGDLDAVLVGNSRATETQTGWYDASTGGVLLGDGRGGFTFRRGGASGLFVDGDAKAAAEVSAGAAGPLVLVTQNDDSVRAFVRAGAPAGRVIALRPLDAYAVLSVAGGGTRRAELYHGSGYLSQSTRRLTLPAGVTAAVVVDFAGTRRAYRF